mmetsp:Transcript_40576/g.29204  ORF Transcript_40576/g.29204 Transcript_40576/m.29204 type:complete len:227 (+) Transcript_40576:976-1656(+)
MASTPVFIALYHEHFYKLRKIGIRRLESDEELLEETLTEEECCEDLSITTIVVASIQMLIVLLLLLYTICFMGLKSEEQLQKDSTRKRCGSLYLDINLKRHGARWMSTIFMTRRIFFVLNLLLLKEFYFLQMYGLVFSSLIVVSIVIHVKPMDGRALNRMEKFNEYCILFSSYFMFMFSDWTTDGEQLFNFGSYYTVFVISILGFNIFIILVTSMGDCFRSVLIRL